MSEKSFSICLLSIRQIPNPICHAETSADQTLQSSGNCVLPLAGTQKPIQQGGGVGSGKVPWVNFRQGKFSAPSKSPKSQPGTGQFSHQSGQTKPHRITNPHQHFAPPILHAQSGSNTEAKRKAEAEGWSKAGHRMKIRDTKETGA